MSQIVVYRQYWMATLKDRHFCENCDYLAKEALFILDSNGIERSIVWMCDNHCLSKTQKGLDSLSKRST
jgi:hypothetical protein